MFYAYVCGNKGGIVTTWDECIDHIKAVPGARFKKISSLEEAHRFVRSFNAVVVQISPMAPNRVTERAPSGAPTIAQCMPFFNALLTAAARTFVYTEGSICGAYTGYAVHFPHDPTFDIYGPVEDAWFNDSQLNKASDNTTLGDVYALYAAISIATNNLHILTNSQYCCDMAAWHYSAYPPYSARSIETIDSYKEIWDDIFDKTKGKNIVIECVHSDVYSDIHSDVVTEMAKKGSRGESTVALEMCIT